MTSTVKITEAPAGSTKQDRIIAMLRAPKGVTIAAVGKATGWQLHSVRGFFSGVVGKKLGLKLACHKAEGGRLYRIVSGGTKTKAKTGPKTVVKATGAKRVSTAKA
jgi:hypothetical protein